MNALVRPGPLSTFGQAHTCRRQVRAAALSVTAAPEAAAKKDELILAVSDINRGLFGVQSDKQQAIHALVSELEALNPLDKPVQHLDQVDGSWQLIYSTIKIMGTKRSKLGLREFVKIGTMYQDIDVSSRTAVNRVCFSVTGFGMVQGQLTITAKFEPAGNERVTVKFQQSTLEPDALQKLFQKNYDLLLSIFNPEGWLDITYVDDTMRIGRDHNGNIFVLERDL